MSEKIILDKNKIYGIFSYIYIPLRICPIYTLIIFINRIITALIPAFTVIVIADFVEKVLAYNRGELKYQKVMLSIILYLTIIIYKNVNQTIINNFINIRFDMKITQKYSLAMIEKQARLKYKYIEDNDTWDLISRVCADPLGKIASGMNNLLDIIEVIVTIGSILAVIIKFAWWVGIIIVVIAIPLIYLAIRGGQAVYKEDIKAKKYERIADYLKSVLINRDNVEERVVFGYSEHISSKWYKKYDDARKINLNIELKYYINMKLAGLFTVIISLLLIGLLVIPLAHNQIGLGIFIGLVTSVYNLVQMIACSLPFIAKEIASSKEYLKDFNEFVSLEEQDGALEMPIYNENDLIRTIEFKNVTFRYPNTDRYILKDFSLKIDRGIKYAFVGSNGAGKTTIIKLLTGLYDDYEGEILINSKNIKNYQIQNLKSFFSIVYQDYAKYFISIIDNILLGNVNNIEKFNKDNVNELNEIKNILNSIGLSKFNSLLYGLNTYLGKISKDSVDISGGEWQRLAIARSLYCDAQIQILDEPTASLDPIAESKLYELFNKISKDKTTIYVTHRLGAAKMADKIVVIEDGRVVELGSHIDLMEIRGIYEKMFLSQKSWYEESQL